MGIATSQQLTRYYDVYRDTDIVFTKQVIKTLNLNPRQISVKCNGRQWPCIINSTSLRSCKIIVNTNGGAVAALAKAGNSTVSIYFCFTPRDVQPITFFVNAKVEDHAIQPFNGNKDLSVVTLNFTQRPPDDLIEIIGTVLEANANSVQRRDERIAITADSKRKLNLLKEETFVYMQNVPRHCIIRDISFSGAKLIMLGVKAFVVNKDVILHFDFTDPQEPMDIKGKVVTVEDVAGRRDLIVANILFDEAQVPISYKLRINSYITSVRKQQLQDNEITQG